MGILINQDHEQTRDYPVRFAKSLIDSIADKDIETLKFIFAKLYDKIYARDARDCRGASLLHVAVEYQSHEITKYLIETIKFDVNLQNDHGQTALMIALKNRDFATTKVLLESDADVCICGCFGTNALQIAIALDPVLSANLNSSSEWLWDYWNIIALILDKIDMKFSSDSEKVADHLLKIHCPLTHVVFMKNSEVMRLMLKKDNHIHVKDRYSGRSALHLAIQYWKLDKVKILLECDADFHVLDYFKKTPMMCIYVNVDFFKMMPPCEVELVTVLVRHLNKLIEENKYKAYIVDDMYQIFRCGSKNGIRAAILESKEYLLLAKNAKRYTLLHALAENLNPLVKEAIRDVKLDINNKSSDGQTAVSRAINYENLDFAVYLFNQGAAFDVTRERVNPVHWTFHHNFLKIPSPQVRLKFIQWMLEFGANIEDTLADENILTLIVNKKEFELGKPILAQFALKCVSGTSISELIYVQIKSLNLFENHFNMCVEQLNKMKTLNINKSVCMFDLMATCDATLARYARNRSFVSNLTKMINQYDFDSYLRDILHKRFITISRFAEWREKAEMIICENIGFLYERNSIVTRMIVDYLDDENVKMLFQSISK